MMRAEGEEVTEHNSSPFDVAYPRRPDVTSYYPPAAAEELLM